MTDSRLNIPLLIDLDVQTNEALYKALMADEVDGEKYLDWMTDFSYAGLKATGVEEMAAWEELFQAFLRTMLIHYKIDSSFLNSKSEDSQKI